MTLPEIDRHGKFRAAPSAAVQRIATGEISS
jgi:hypothetical protein